MRAPRRKIIDPPPVWAPERELADAAEALEVEKWEAIRQALTEQPRMAEEAGENMNWRLVRALGDGRRRCKPR